MTEGEVSLATIWERERRSIAAVLLAHKPAESDLEDLLQEVALVLIKQHVALRDPTKLGPWLRSVALNVARTARRKSRVRRRVHRPFPTDGTEFEDPAAIRDREHAAARAAAERVVRLVEALAPGYREPLVLSCVHGMSQRQVAAFLGITEMAVESRLARARKMLRVIMNRNLEDASAREPRP